MNDSSYVVDNYRIEVSGWGLDSMFFVEKTDLLWAPTSEFSPEVPSRKKLRLHRALSEGAVIFVRLLSSESAINSVPVPYRIESIQPMDCNGQCEITVQQLHPRATNAPIGNQLASNAGKSSGSVPEERQSPTALELEEVLHEA